MLIIQIIEMDKNLYIIYKKPTTNLKLQKMTFQLIVDYIITDMYDILSKSKV